MKKIVATALTLILASPALAQQPPAAANAQPANMDNEPEVVPHAPADTYEPVSEHSNSMIHSGLGGPIEERTNYPPCRRGAGDDNCIQLYERGVTGAGN